MRSMTGAAIALLVAGSAAFAEPLPPDQFVKKASIGNSFEIEQASLALKQSSNPKVKEFAHMMTTDHTKAEKKLEEAAHTTHAMPAQKLDDAHQMKVDALRGTTGAAFDTAYIADQIAAHEETAALLDDYQKSGDNAALKDWAAATLPAVKAHLEHAKSMSPM